MCFFSYHPLPLSSAIILDSFNNWMLADKVLCRHPVSIASASKAGGLVFVALLDMSSLLVSGVLSRESPCL